MLYLKNLKRSDLKGKTALVRVDFNAEGKKGEFRLRSSLPTIRFLHALGAKVIILSHRGRPRGAEKKYSLRAVLPFLRKYLDKRIEFFPDFDFKKIKSETSLSSKTTFLLENLRFLAGESKNSPALAEQLAEFGDIYVNDAFAASHRKNASITELPKLLPAYAGLLLEKEVLTLDKILKTNLHPFVVILGGAKAKDKIGVIEHLLKRVDCFLVGGVTANTFLKARGAEIGKSIYEPEMIAAAKKLVWNKKIVIPADFVSFQNKYLDIGASATKVFVEKIKTAKMIVWSGPLGLTENKRFRAGSAAIAKAVAESGAFSVIGGGETTQLIHDMKLEKKTAFLSTGGGAMIEYMAGKKLPGIQALK